MISATKTIARSKIIQRKRSSNLITSANSLENIMLDTSTKKCHTDSFFILNKYKHDLNKLHIPFNRSLSTGKQRKLDPTAKRPNKICDPYGLEGKPLSLNEAKQQISMLDEGWKLGSEEQSEMTQPIYLEKEFCHRNYLEGSKFIAKLAAVAHNNNHFFSMKLERRLMRREKKWKIVTKIGCHTEVLGGLSFHDFHIAMLIDVEVARNDLKALIIPDTSNNDVHIHT